MKEEIYIYVSKDKFEIRGNGWDLFLALKVLFKNLKEKQPELHKLVCKKLIDCGVFCA